MDGEDRASASPKILQYKMGYKNKIKHTMAMASLYMVRVHVTRFVVSDGMCDVF
jgi:hypothetical protein